MQVTRENPGQTFVGILPGHHRPAFVRKRKSSGYRLPRLFDPRRSCSYGSERTYHCVVRSPSRYHTDSHHTTVLTDQPVFVNESGPRPLPYYLRPKPRTGKHTCGSCGKFRSPSYCKRHPLADGEDPKPSLCRKCVKGSTDSGSENSYEKYRKEQKRRRRRGHSSSDERWERQRKERRYSKRHSDSCDYSWERYREEERYRGLRRRYSVDERSSYSDWERKERPRVIYVQRSSSGRHTRSSSGGGSSVAISYKHKEPRRSRRSSESRSSADKIRIVRRAIERPERRRRPRSRSMSEESYRRRYRSFSGSSGGKSVRFKSPIRRYRGRGYDGEMASYEDRAQSSLHKPSRPVLLSLESFEAIDLKLSSDGDRTAASGGTRDPGDGSRISPIEPTSQGFRYVRGSSEIREAAALYKRKEDRRHSSTPFLMSGSRGRSLSSDRHAAEINRSRESSKARSRTGSEAKYNRSLDEDSAEHVLRTYRR